MDDILTEFIDDLVFEAAIEMKWLIKTKQITIEDIYHIKPPPSTKKVYQVATPQEKTTFSVTGTQASTLSATTSRFVSCNVCGKDIAGNRFAPHLERCMNGGARITTSGFDLLPDTVKVKKEPVDPHPTSMVIRIKMRNGVPITKTRIGATYEEFLQHKNKPG